MNSILKYFSAVAFCFFFALPSIAADVFSDRSILNVELSAPLQDLFKKDAQRASADKAPIVLGTLSYTALSGTKVSIPVKVAVRGETSRSDENCKFKKLKLELDPTKTAGTLFESHQKIKIGTHCGDAPAPLYNSTQRLARQEAAEREETIYELLRLAEVPTYLTRPASLTYIDGTSKLTRRGFFLESDESAGKRVGGKQVKIDIKHIDPSAPQVKPTPKPGTEFYEDEITNRVDVAKVAQIFFGEALVGNGDWLLALTHDDFVGGQGDGDPVAVKNITLFAPSSGGLRIPLMYDLDGSSSVRDRSWLVEGTYNLKFTSNPSPYHLFALSYLQRARRIFPRSMLDQVRKQFLDHKAALYDSLSKASVDEPGRALIQKHLDSFYQLIEAPIFYMQVTGAPIAKVMTDVAHSVACTEDSDPLPAHLPIRVLQKSGDWMQVNLLNVTEGSSCIDKPVWIPASTPMTDAFPNL